MDFHRHSAPPQHATNAFTGQHVLVLFLKSQEASLSFRNSASTIATCPLVTLRSASAGANHAARSASGNSARLPDRGGHSISNVLLRKFRRSKSPSAAQAVITLPPDCLK